MNLTHSRSVLLLAVALPSFVPASNVSLLSSASASKVALLSSVPASNVAPLSPVPASNVSLPSLMSALNVRGAGLQPGKSPVQPQLPIADAIKHLGDLDYTKRTRAAASLRRRASAEVAPALLEALERNADGYVRFRVLVLLSAFNNPRVPDVMRGATFDPNDRLREVAYSYFEGHPDPSLLGTFLEALDKETSEFVRPSLVRAIAALGADPRARQVMLREVMRGQDFFRSGVIEALGDHKATYAVDALITIAGLEGPLQDDAALALGKVGARKALPVLAGLQRTAPKDTQPAVAAAICLLGVNCEAHRGFLVRSLTFAEDTAGFQSLVRSAAAALAPLAVYGDREAASALVDIGIPSHDPARAPIALASATVAVKNPALLMALLEPRADRRVALSLIAEGFDMLEEDYLEEQFFARVRKAYWGAPEGSATRATAQEIIGALDF